MKKGRLIGCLALVASAFLWATAYIAVKQLVAEVPPSVLLAFRFSFAAIILAVICIPKFKHYTKDLLFSGMKMGTAMFFEFFLFTVALQYTSASKSSFIIASYIIILPIVYLIIRRKKPTGSDVLASESVWLESVFSWQMGWIPLIKVICSVPDVHFPMPYILYTRRNSVNSMMVGC